MGKSRAPAPPDPKKTSAAQTGTNIGTAIANNSMGLVNQVTPDGSLTYDQTGSYSYVDPYTGQSYDLPQYTATTQLSEAGQAIQDQNQGAQLNLASLANDRSDFLRDYLPTTEAATDQIDSKLYELGSKRLDPRFAQEEEALRTRLANQGIAPGSEAYNRELSQMGQTKNDAYNQLLLAGRGQAASEVNMPINQITALLSGSQVSNPNVALYQPQGAATTDVAGLINQNYNQKYNNYQSDVSQKNSLLGGLFGLGSSAILASDVRVKEDIEEIGRRDDGLGVYRFRYVGRPEIHIGFMAQEVERVYPEAVIEINGVKHVNYGGIQ